MPRTGSGNGNGNNGSSGSNSSSSSGSSGTPIGVIAGGIVGVVIVVCVGVVVAWVFVISPRRKAKGYGGDREGGYLRSGLGKGDSMGGISVPAPVAMSILQGGKGGENRYNVLHDPPSTPQPTVVTPVSAPPPIVTIPLTIPTVIVPVEPDLETPRPASPASMITVVPAKRQITPAETVLNRLETSAGVQRSTTFRATGLDEYDDVDDGKNLWMIIFLNATGGVDNPSVDHFREDYFWLQNDWGRVEVTCSCSSNVDYVTQTDDGKCEPCLWPDDGGLCGVATSRIYYIDTVELAQQPQSPPPPPPSIVKPPPKSTARPPPQTSQPSNGNNGGNPGTTSPSPSQPVGSGNPNNPGIGSTGGTNPSGSNSGSGSGSSNQNPLVSPIVTVSIETVTDSNGNTIVSTFTTTMESTVSPTSTEGPANGPSSQHPKSGNNGGNNPNNDNINTKTPIGALAGGIIAALVVLIACVIAGWMYVGRFKQAREEEKKRESEMSVAMSDASTAGPGIFATLSRTASSNRGLNMFVETRRDSMALPPLTPIPSSRTSITTRSYITPTLPQPQTLQPLTPVSPTRSSITTRSYITPTLPNPQIPIPSPTSPKSFRSMTTTSSDTTLRPPQNARTVPEHQYPYPYLNSNSDKYPFRSMRRSVNMGIQSKDMVYQQQQQLELQLEIQRQLQREVFDYDLCAEFELEEEREVEPVD
ncbi:hypothetical protein HDU76_002015 [Blyttiomyces sp. JEL0837]|nr:hypothetical protein HDU76_002015 [Blyttiomyces sp. JEL0837]